MNNTFTVTITHKINGDLQQYRELELENTPEGISSAIMAFGQIVQEANYVDACSILDDDQLMVT